MNEHRILLIALCGEQYDVVGAFKVEEWMVACNLLQRDGSLAYRLSIINVCTCYLHLCYKSPALAFAFKHFATLLEVCVELRQVLPEVIYAAVEIFVRYKKMFFHIFLFYLVACLASEDDQFAYHILAAEVYARVWLRVALLLSTPDSLGERHVGADFVEYEIERARQHSFYL